jgi:hypothetical protein
MGRLEAARCFRPWHRLGERCEGIGKKVFVVALKFILIFLVVEVASVQTLCCSSVGF